MHIGFNIKALIIYLVLLTASVVFASFYGGLFPFVILYGMLFFISVLLVFILLEYHFLSVFQELSSRRVLKGDPHDFFISFENRSFLPIHDMELILHSERCDFADISDGDRISVSPFGEMKISTKVECRYGGNYEIGLKSIGFTDPFGIMRVVFNVPYTFRAIVSPRITDVAYRYLDMENIINSCGSKSEIRYEETAGNDMRNYMPGDPKKNINWKVSARLDRLIVRTPDRMDTRRITLILEPANVPERLRDTEFLKRRDCFLEFAVSAAWYFVRRGLPVLIIYPSGKITERMTGSEESFMEFYKDISGGISYRSDDEKERMHTLVQERRKPGYGSETRVLVLEDEWPGEDFCIIAD